MKTIVTGVLIMLFNSYLLAQTGPGGVGSGATTLEVWFDGKDVNGNGTNPATSATVSTWTDKSGNSRNVTQNIANVATYSAAGGVTFNNTGYLLGSDAGLPSGGAARTVLLVASSPSSSTDDNIFFYGKVGTPAVNNQSYGINRVGTSGNIRNYFYNNDLNDAGGWTPANQTKIINTWYQSNSQKIYLNGNVDVTAASTPNTVLGDGLQIGGWSYYTAYSQATINEVILYSSALNPAELNIVNNYLSEKYSVTLASTDYYSGHSGSYINGVQGIGTTDGTAANSHLVSANSGGLEIQSTNGSTGLNSANEYIFTGYAGTTNSVSTSNLATVPTVMQRWSRIWYLKKTGTANVTLSFNFSTDGIGGTPASTHYVLLYSASDSPLAFSILSSSSSVSGSTVSFSIANASLLNGYYTIGTTDPTNSPLPVSLINFKAQQKSDKVMVDWQTAYESNNAYFTVQRSTDLTEWEDIAKVTGAGNSSSIHSYSIEDNCLCNGITYYRLKQTDFDGASTFSASVSVFSESDITIFPNPSSGEITVAGLKENVKMEVFNSIGLALSIPVAEQNDKIKMDFSALPSGIYFISFENNDGTVFRKKIIIFGN